MEHVMPRPSYPGTQDRLEREFERVVQRVERRERALGRLRVLAGVWTAVGAATAGAAALAFVAVAPWGWISGDPTATWLLGGLASVLAGAALALSAPALAVGLGLRAGRSWARALALLLAVLLLFWVPLGTLLGIATLAVLLDENTREAFEGPARRTR